MLNFGVHLTSGHILIPLKID